MSLFFLKNVEWKFEIATHEFMKFLEIHLLQF